MELNRQILRDCGSLDGAVHIRWLEYIKNFVYNLGHPEYFLDPSTLCEVQRKDFKFSCLDYLEEKRKSVELKKLTVQAHQLSVHC